MLAFLLLTVLPNILAVIPSRAQAAPPGPISPVAGAIYVSPAGSDRADGRSPATAFRSLERAEAAVVAGQAGTVYLAGGVFRLSRSLTIRPTPWPQRWLAMPGSRPVLDGGGTTDQAMFVSGHDVLVEGFHVTNFAANGIAVGSADGVVIRGNRISRISSAEGTRAGIMVIQAGRNVVVENNVVDDTGYAGIGYFASEGGDLGGARIVGNRISRTCTRVGDCGAIYISGRAPSARGAVVRHNHVTDYGPIGGHEAKAIYLDDGLSGAEVSGNTIGGTGTYAIHLHGGSDNRVYRNIVDLPAGQPFMFHQELEGRGARRMTGNDVSGNIVRSPGSTALNIKYGGLASRPLLRANRVTQR